MLHWQRGQFILVSCTAGASLSKAAHKHEAAQKLIQEEYSRNVTQRLRVPSPLHHCQCKITQTSWCEWKCNLRIILSLNKLKYQLCLQTSIALMILLAIIGWKESNIAMWSLASYSLIESSSQGVLLLLAGCGSTRSCAGDIPCRSFGFGGLPFLSLTQCHSLNLSKMQTNRLFLLHQLYTL